MRGEVNESIKMRNEINQFIHNPELALLCFVQMLVRPSTIFLAPTDSYNLFAFLFGVLLFKHDELLQNTKMLHIDVESWTFTDRTRKVAFLKCALLCCLSAIHAARF